MMKLIEKATNIILIIACGLLVFRSGYEFNKIKQEQSKHIKLTNPAPYQVGDTLRISPLNAGRVTTVIVGE